MAGLYEQNKGHKESVCLSKAELSLSQSSIPHFQRQLATDTGLLVSETEETTTSQNLIKFPTIAECKKAKLKLYSHVK